MHDQKLTWHREEGRRQGACWHSQKSVLLQSMRETFLLKLSLSFHSSPVLNAQSTNIFDSTFCKKRTGADGSVAPITAFVLAMSFVEDDGVDLVEFIKSIVLNVFNYSIKH